MAGFLSLMPAMAPPASSEGPILGARYIRSAETLALPPFALRPWPKTFHEAAQASMAYQPVASTGVDNPVKAAISERADALRSNWKPFAAGMTVVCAIWAVCAFGKLQSIGAASSAFSEFVATHASTEFSQNFRSSRVGQFSILGPTTGMRDYHVEFMAESAEGSLGVALRALNPRNYYAVKINLVRTGHKPAVSVDRYAVIDGVKQKGQNFPVSASIFADQPFVATIDVIGSDFQLAVGGEAVDSWKFDRLKGGGVGFFADSTSKTKLNWVKVVGNPDFLGKLCATLKGSVQGL